MPGGRGPRKKAATAQHGGYRKPASPAPVSAPGAASSRTDGGPSQPVRPIPSSGPGSTIGDRQASVDLQQGAPLAAGGDVQPMAVPVQQGPMPAGAPAADPFGPSRRPGEPVTAGAMLGPGATPNPQENLRDKIGAWYAETGNPVLLDVLEELDEELG
jgi:hypothetical protein